MSKLNVTALVFALAWTGLAMAQQKPSLDIGIQPLTDDALKCGVTKSSVESIAALTLRNNGVQPKEFRVGYNSPFLYVNITALSIGDGRVCVANIQAGITTMVPARSYGVFKPRDSHQLDYLCNESGVMTGLSNDFGERVISKLEQEIKLCLGKLVY